MYKDTIFLPKTAFPMKAGLATKEPKILEHWQKVDLYNEQRRRFKGRPKFVLHSGPPYANGHTHIGHALNNILKDVVVRSQQMLGKDCSFIPGWDCHGLPIEWKIEEKYRAKGKNKDEVDILEFREECRKFAAHWIDIQKTEIQRMGVVGNWDNAYTTMKFENEGVIVEELSKFLLSGALYRGFRPVMWSVVEKTALAEAEVEYKDKTSPSIYVKFPIKKSSHSELLEAHAVIWTTTPWTLPANRAIAYHDDVEYVAIKINAVVPSEHLKSFATAGDVLLVAAELLPNVCGTLGIGEKEIVGKFKGCDLQGTICAHPLRDQGYTFDVSMLHGDHVGTDAGTGLVHTAPSHGVEDFALGKAHDLEVPDLLQDDGRYRPGVPVFEGLHIYKANEPVMDAIESEGCLLGKGSIEHSYPHSWRSKAPLIYRATPQWFISMDHDGLRSKALSEIERVDWFPAAGQNRIEGMVKDRPDWCVSRQRAWGVPLPIFVHKETNEILKDERVQERIIEAVKEFGADAWFEKDNTFFLGGLYEPDQYQKIHDVVDVWFDAGSTHVFTLEKDPNETWPADLYLEGSDQHRGWFQSSLLESCSTRGRAPYDAVLTHGFVLDEKGYKMSKSQGNVVSPMDVMNEMGADILRLWVISSDYFDDVRIGKSILKHQQDIYRRYRNTLRYLLGALDGFADDEKLSYEELPSLERWVLHRLHELDQLHKKCIETYDFKTFYAELHNFCASELSSLYFDVRKDSLYCDNVKSIRRRAARTVMDTTFETLVRWIAPVLCFTAEEAYLERLGNPADASIHFETYVNIPNDWQDKQLADQWQEVFEVRSLITGAIEHKRAEKVLGSSLQAAVKLTLSESDYEKYASIDWAEICIASNVDVIKGSSTDVEVSLAEGGKCERCWKVAAEVNSSQSLCNRCSGVVESA